VPHGSADQNYYSVAKSWRHIFVYTPLIMKKTHPRCGALSYGGGEDEQVWLKWDVPI
jgi:hypothetical protein